MVPVTTIPQRLAVNCQLYIYLKILQMSTCIKVNSLELLKNYLFVGNSMYYSILFRFYLGLPYLLPMEKVPPNLIRNFL